jgi:ribosome-binding factor A
MTRRTQQMGEFLREEVVDIIRSEIDDPRLGFWTVTRVEVLPDLRSARIYVSVLGTDGERKETITALRGAAGFIRGHLKPRMRTRIIPDLDFRDGPRDECGVFGVYAPERDVRTYRLIFHPEMMKQQQMSTAE